MQLFAAALDEVDEPRADNARHRLGELLVIAFDAASGGIAARIATAPGDSGVIAIEAAPASGPGARR
jgi:hypothetical protein